MLAGAGSCSLIGGWTGCGSMANAVRATGPDALQDALALAQGAIQAPGKRLPEFLTWSTRRGIANCTTPSNELPDHSALRGTADSRLHNFPQGRAVPPPAATTDFGSLGFYYDDATRKRLCEPAINVAGATAASPVIMSGGVGQWWKNSAMPIDSIDTGFPIGARAGAAIWTKIKRPAAPTVQNFQFNFRRGGTRATLPVAINISSEFLRRGTAGTTVCTEPLTPPGPANASANPNALELRSFYWVQIQDSRPCRPGQLRRPDGADRVSPSDSKNRPGLALEYFLVGSRIHRIQTPDGLAGGRRRALRLAKLCSRCRIWTQRGALQPREGHGNERFELRILSCPRGFSSGTPTGRNGASGIARSARPRA